MKPCHKGYTSGFRHAQSRSILQARRHAIASVEDPTSLSHDGLWPADDRTVSGAPRVLEALCTD